MAIEVLIPIEITTSTLGFQGNAFARRKDHPLAAEKVKRELLSPEFQLIPRRKGIRSRRAHAGRRAHGSQVDATGASCAAPEYGSRLFRSTGERPSFSSLFPLRARSMVSMVISVHEAATAHAQSLSDQQPSISSDCFLPPSFSASSAFIFKAVQLTSHDVLI